MKLYINRETGETTPTYIHGKLLTYMRLDAQFLDEDGQITALEDDVTLHLAAKTKYNETAYLLEATEWTYDDSDLVYTLAFTITGAIEELFASAPCHKFIAEIEWKESGNTFKSETFMLVIQNAVIKPAD